MKLILTSLEHSINLLEDAILATNQIILCGNDFLFAVNTLKAGVVQNFEFTYEQSWKLMKRWIEANVSPDAVGGVARRELFRIAAENKLINDIEKWMIFHSARNKTSHLYDRVISQQVYEMALEFLPYAKQLLKQLEARNQ